MTSKQLTQSGGAISVDADGGIITRAQADAGLAAKPRLYPPAAGFAIKIFMPGGWRYLHAEADNAEHCVLITGKAEGINRARIYDTRKEAQAAARKITSKRDKRPPLVIAAKRPAFADYFYVARKGGGGWALAFMNAWAHELAKVKPQGVIIRRADYDGRGRYKGDTGKIGPAFITAQNRAGRVFAVAHSYNSAERYASRRAAMDWRAKARRYKSNWILARLLPVLLA